MLNPFSGTPNGRPFRPFGVDHLAGLAVTGVAVAALIRHGRTLDDAGRQRARRRILAGLWGQEASYHLWRAATRTWSTQDMLPLHLCSSVIWAGGVHLLRPNQWGDDVTWYWGLAGAPVALLSPDIGDFTFPHYRYLQFFGSHGLILALPLWNVFVEGRRPSQAGARQAFFSLLGQAAVVAVVNARIGSNYLFIGRKVDTASPLDVLPKWPYYIPILAGMAGGVFYLLALPFRDEDGSGE